MKALGLIDGEESEIDDDGFEIDDGDDDDDDDDYWDLPYDGWDYIARYGEAKLCQARLARHRNILLRFI